MYLVTSNLEGKCQFVGAFHGVDPKALQITVDKGVLVIAGERKSELPEGDDVSTFAQERFNGTFRRVMSLPADVDAGRIEVRVD